MTVVPFRPKPANWPRPAPAAPMEGAALLSSIRSATLCLAEAWIRHDAARDDRTEYAAWGEIEAARDLLEALLLDAEATGVLARCEAMLRAGEAGQ